jgi:hypothetical protein
MLLISTESFEDEAGVCICSGWQIYQRCMWEEDMILTAFWSQHENKFCSMTYALEMNKLVVL